MSQTVAEPTETDSQAGTPPRGLRAGRSLWADAWRRLRRDWVAMLCLGVIGLYALIAIGAFAYEFTAERYDKWPSWSEMSDYDYENRAPSMESWRTIAGTDWAGRPVWVETLLGAKVSMTVGLMANLIAVPLGMVLGAIAGFYGKAADSFIVWLFSTLASIPGIMLLISLKFAFRAFHPFGIDLTGINGLYIALGVMSWIGTCRLVRAETMKLRELDYVIAARAAGRNSFAILLRHIVPNVLHIGIISFSLGFVGAVQAEVILSYLKIGVAVGTPSWGTMIDAARQSLMQGRWWELTSAVAAMFFLVLALNIFGDRLRDALDPRLRNL